MPPLLARLLVPTRARLALLVVLAVGLAATAFALLRPSPLLFEDEFSGSGLDADRWSTCYFFRASHCTNEYNDELEVYTPENVTVRDGQLRLTAREEPTDGFRQDGSPITLPYSSGMVSTAGRFSFTRGYVEFRAQVPEGRGLWPALWLLPEHRGWPPEIDVMEFIGHQPDRVYLTNHPEDAPAASKAHIGPRFPDGMHLFGVERREDAVVWYVDGVERFRVTEGVPDVPMYLVANLAVGGSWPGPPDGTTAFPAVFRLDRVQVWRDRLDSPTFAAEREESGRAAEGPADRDPVGRLADGLAPRRPEPAWS